MTSNIYILSRANCTALPSEQSHSCQGVENTELSDAAVSRCVVLMNHADHGFSGRHAKPCLGPFARVMPRLTKPMHLHIT